MEKRASNTFSLIDRGQLNSEKITGLRLKTQGYDTRPSTFAQRIPLEKISLFNNYKRWMRSSEKRPIRVEQIIYPNGSFSQKENRCKFLRTSCKKREKVYTNFQGKVKISQTPRRMFCPDKAMIDFRKRIKEIREISKKALQGDAEKQQPKEKFEVCMETLIGTKHQENQDVIRVAEGIYIICDGHGSNGKEVASFVASTLIDKCLTELGDGKITKSALWDIFKKTEFDLEISGLDIAFSGCACILVLKRSNQIMCATVGDSKAFIRCGYKNQVLSFEHKPERPGERERILKFGGVIKQAEVSKDKYVGPQRIWAPGRNSWGPGLAMSRAFGDKAAKRYGIISEPEITEYQLTDSQDFLVIGSDGLFDQLSFEQISTSIRKYQRDDTSREEICRLLAQDAYLKWEDESDDISLILIFF